MPKTERYISDSLHLIFSGGLIYPHLIKSRREWEFNCSIYVMPSQTRPRWSQPQLDIDYRSTFYKSPCPKFSFAELANITGTKLGKKVKHGKNLKEYITWLLLNLLVTSISKWVLKIYLSLKYLSELCWKFNG